MMQYILKQKVSFLALPSCQTITHVDIFKRKW